MAKNNNPKPPTTDRWDNWDVPEEKSEQSTGYPAYWTPDDYGAKFAGVVLMRDESGDFARYVLRATKPTCCRRGSGYDVEEVLVKPGEFFTVSMYNNLQLDRYIGLGEVIVICKGKIKANTPAGFVWGFRLWIDKAAEQKLLEKDNRNPLLNPKPAAAASDEPAF